MRKPANKMGPVLFAIGVMLPIVAGIGWLGTVITNIAVAPILLSHGQKPSPETVVHYSDMLGSLLLMWAVTSVIMLLIGWFLPLPSGPRPPMPPRFPSFDDTGDRDDG